MTTDTTRIAKLLGVEAQGDTTPRQVNRLLIDSRSLSVPEATLFIAIPTDTADGAKYILPLYERGVRIFVAREIPAEMQEVTDATFFIVPDPVKALQQIAARSRDFSGIMTAITGSRGKTTLKEWIFQLMEPLADIIRSPRSWNSQIGVPLSLWEVQPDTELAIIEAGISQSGEMQSLAECIAPDMVIITNVGSAHDEGFASRADKVREKVKLAAYSTVKQVIYCADHTDIAAEIERTCRGKKLTGWSLQNPDAPLYVKVRQLGENLTELDYSMREEEGRNVNGKLTAAIGGGYDVENAVNALAFMLLRGIDPEVIADRFSKLHKIGLRLNVSEGVNGCSVIYDSYTSDFSSLTPALDFMRRRSMPGMEPVLILSDLRHESAGKDDLYTRIAALVKSYGIRRFIGIGTVLASHAALFPEESRFFSDTAEMLKVMSPSDFTDNVILLKGAPEFGFEAIREMLEARTHETVLEVNLNSIVKNYNYFRSFVPQTTGMIAMVKASGYGAGSYEIAKTLQDCGAAYLAVAVLDEGIDLRKQGISMPIMVMNPKVVNYRAMFANRLEPEIYSFSMLRDVIREAEKCGVTGYPIHLKLDTGMHRMGFVEEDLPEVMQLVNSGNRVVIRSVFSHLATADCPDMNDYTELQLERFRRYSDYILSQSKTPVLRHVLNSAGILRFPEHHYDMVRLGIGLYGVNTLPADMEKKLHTVSTLRTVIIAIREYKAGETIGYGRRGLLTRDSRIATIPIGYADGMNRHFGRGAISVKVNGMDAPTVGNICMDACMIDVTDVPCKEGDAVEIFGAKADVLRLAEVLDTIPYEILTSVSPRVKRVYYRE